MRTLKENLTLISQWLKTHQPDSYNALQLGLSRSEVEYFLETQKFILPDEFYELYQWHDGMSLLDAGMDGLYSMNPYQLFPGYTFNSLQSAITRISHKKCDREPRKSDRKRI